MKKDLNAGLPALHMQRDDVWPRSPARVVALCRLHVRQRADAIAKGRGAFEFHCLGGLPPCRWRAAPAESVESPLRKRTASRDRGRHSPLPELADAGRRTALDLLLEQARAAWRLSKVRYGSVAPARRPFCNWFRGAVFTAPALSERAEISRPSRFGPRCFLIWGKGMLAADQDVGKALVVAQHHL